MTNVLWMTIDRHPESLKALIRDHLTEAGFTFFEVSYDTIDQLASIPLEDINAVLLAPARFFPLEYMDRLTRCVLMQIWSSGYDKFNIGDAKTRNIPVANNHGSNATSVAEHTILMMLGVSRRIPEMHERATSGNWAGNDHGMSSYSLSGKTLGIVGLGNIGTLVAKRAEALGMAIIFSDPGISMSPEDRWSKVDFGQLLHSSDYITFHVHLSESTKGMINMENVGSLARQPFLINPSRAELIDRVALLSAMENELIKGVAIDAHYDEPTDPEDPLFAFPNVLFSPHVAGSTVDSYRDTIEACTRNIGRAISDSTPLGPITLTV
jgi:phosphoglycerate dehydrogenase-like enzyme